MDISLVLYSQSEGVIYSYVIEIEHGIRSGEFFFLKSGFLVQIENMIFNETTQERLATCRLVLAGVSGEYDGKKILLPFGYMPHKFVVEHLHGWTQNLVDKNWDWVVATGQPFEIEDIQE